MDNFFEKNIEALKQRLANFEIQNQLVETIETLETPSKEIVARCGTVLLHSSYDPV